jgi:hypothetical protein
LVEFYIKKVLEKRFGSKLMIYYCLDSEENSTDENKKQPEVKEK